MGPFNKGEVGYIKAIAGTNDHKTYKQTYVNHNANLNATTFASLPGQLNAQWKMYNLGDAPQVFTAGSPTDPAPLGASQCENIDVYSIPVNGDQSAASEQQRVTPECFFESVSLKMRVLQRLADPSGSNHALDHCEYRLVVFRHKEKQHNNIQHAANFSNPTYDLFVNNAGYKIGVNGLRMKMENEGNENYDARTGYDGSVNDSDTLMTAMVNKEDYVVMKDVRFYLGNEYGGKHIYETMLRWDHQDPISTDDEDITTTASLKNYCWYIFLLKHSNMVGTRATAASEPTCVKMSATTFVTSG
jgi:hypothetical protein